MIFKYSSMRIPLCSVILIVGMSFVPIVSAGGPPPLPNVFEGNLLADGANAPEGTTISAYMDSKLVNSNTIKEKGKYQLTISGTDKDNGKKITFKLAGIESEPVDVVYKHGALPENLDLTFKGNFKLPFIESIYACPAYILNDGKDFSFVKVKVRETSSECSSVTLDLSPLGQGIVSLKSEGGGIYTYCVCATSPGDYKFILTVKDSSGNEIKNKVSISVLKKKELVSRYGGSDMDFSGDEIEDLVGDDELSSGIKYAILEIYFGDGRIEHETAQL